MQNEKFMPTRGICRCKNSGITLVELIIVIAIVGILVIALAFSFEGWMGKYKVEGQIKEMHSDLTNTRANAMSRSRVHFFTFPTATSYTIYADDSDGVAKVPDGDGNFQPGTGVAADTQVGGFPRTVQYTIDAFTRDDTAGTSTAVITTNVTITFDSRGLVSAAALFTPGITTGIIRLTSTSSPDYDCIIISQTSINMGQWNGTTANCVVK